MVEESVPALAIILKSTEQTEDNKIIFETPLVLPFGTITLSFDGNVTSNKINGTLTLKMPDGNENKVPFSGEKVVI